MTLFSYEIFDAVARQGSFNKAAQQLHLTPSAISHAIAVMEAELGFTLFNRGKNGVTMTSYGASLYPSIRAVLNSDEALQQSIARLNGLEKGKVKLGAFNSVCAGLLPQILKSFMASYPQIEVEVYQGTYDDVKEWLRTGQVDLAFLSASCREEFNLTELFREPLLCIVPQDWPEPPNGIMTPELMNGQSFVVQCDATDAEMRQFLKKYSIWVWLSSAPRRWLRRSSRCSTTSWTSAARWTRSFSENTKMTGPQRCGPVFIYPIGRVDD